MTSETSITALLGGADLPADAMQALDVHDVGEQIMAGMGTVTPDDIESSEAVLLTLLPDDTASMSYEGNADAARDGHNLVLDALTDSQDRDSVLASTLLMSGKVVSPFKPVEQATRLDGSNYRASYPRTPLYDRSVEVLGLVLAKTQEFEDQGVPIRSITVIVTDGANNAGQARAADVKALVDEMRRRENHIVCLLGIDDGSTDFHAVARQMGIDERWVLTPKNTASEIRQAFLTVSRASQAVSQASGTFSQTAAGGFAD